MTDLCASRQRRAAHKSSTRPVERTQENDEDKGNEAGGREE